MANSIEIKFINKSYDRTNADVVFYQKNVADSFDNLAIAWQVIQNCGHNWSHIINYPMVFQIGSMDAFGNVSDLQTATNGQKWAVVRDATGDVLALAPDGAGAPDEIDLVNGLTYGAITAQIYKNGSLLATKTNVAPGQKAVFEFEPTLFVALAAEVEKGDVLNTAVISNTNTAISLLGVTKAELILVGGGDNPYSFQFNPIW